MRLAFHMQKNGGNMTIHTNERRSLVARAHRRAKQSGAALTEYSLLLVAVLICAAGAIKMIGPSVGCAGLSATESLPGVSDGSSGCGGATASASTSGGASGSSSGANGSAADESGGSANGGYVASSTPYDDGAGGFIGGSGSSNGGLAAGNSADFDPGMSPPSNASTAGSSGASGFGGSGSVGGSGGGSAGGGSAGASAPASVNGPEDQYASEGNNFAEKMAGKKPKKLDLTFAKLAIQTDSYDGKTPTKGADGWTPLTRAQLANAHITHSMLVDNNSGFAAQIMTDGKGDYVVVYRGTQGNYMGNPSELTDGLQGLGVPTKEFAEADRLAKAAKNAYGGNVVLAGHSLGGGLAASAAMGTGLPAVTYNPSGVHNNTLSAIDGVDPSKARAQAANGQVRDYEGTHELLTGVQDTHPWMPQALGNKIKFADPNAALTKADAAKSSILNPWPLLNREGALHTEVVKGLETGSVSYEGSDGKPQTYSFTNPKP